MDNLDIHALRVFLESAKSLSFSEAGRTLNLTQPAISMQIKAMEEFLGAKLFERRSQGLVLTRAGSLLIPQAERILAMVINAEENVRATATEVAGELTIGCSAAGGKYLLPPLVAQFCRLYPDVYVSIYVEPRASMMADIVNGTYDLGVTSLRIPDVDVSYRPFFTDTLVLIVSASHRWAKRGEPIEPSELLEEDFICREPASACRVTVSGALATHGIDMYDLRMVMQVGNAEALAMAVEYGLGVSFVSVLAAQPRVALGRLATVPIRDMVLTNPVELALPNNRATAAAAGKFVEYLTDPKHAALIRLLSEGRMI